MFVTAVCFLFLVKLKWPKNKNIYDVQFNRKYNIFGLEIGFFSSTDGFPAFDGAKEKPEIKSVFPGWIFPRLLVT